MQEQTNHAIKHCHRDPCTCTRIRCYFLIRHDIQIMLGQHIPVLLLADSNQLFTILIRAQMTTGRRLIVDIASVREAYNERTIANVALIRSADIYADGLTKLPPNASLSNLLRTHKVSRHHAVHHRAQMFFIVMMSRVGARPCVILETPCALHRATIIVNRHGTTSYVHTVARQRMLNQSGYDT